MKTSCIL